MITRAAFPFPEEEQQPMSNLEMIQRLCEMLDTAQKVIREQAELLEMHGIETDDGGLEEERTRLLTDIENSI